MSAWRRWTTGTTVVAIVGLGAVCYLPSLRYPYLQDALKSVATNPVVARGDIVEIFRSDYWKDTQSFAHELYRPVTVLSFALERRIAGEPSPLLSHLFNTVLHLLAAIALHAYARRLGAGESLAAAAALLFTVHPLLLQGVVNVVGRADSLSLLFTLLALLLGSRAGPWRDQPAPAAWVARSCAWASAFALFLALGAKEVAVAAPGLLLVQDLLFRFPWRRLHGVRFWLDRAAALAPCAIALLVWIVLRTAAIGEFPGVPGVPPEDNVIVFLGLEGTARIATALGMAARYAGLLVFPSALSADYSGTEIRSYDSILAAEPLAGLALLAALAFVALRPSRARIASMGAWIFLLAYAIVGNLIVLNAAGFAERLMYYPAAGFVLLAAALAHRLCDFLPRARLPLALLLAVLLVAGVVQTMAEARMWRSQRDLFERSLRATPRSLRFTLAMGHLHRHEGDMVAARASFERNAELAPGDAGAWSDLGIFYFVTGENSLAERALETAIRLDPRRGEAWANLGRVLRRTGRPAEAEPALRKALLLRPDLEVSAEELGRLLLEDGRYREAAHYFRGCVKLGRRDLLPLLEQAEALQGGAELVD